MSRRQQDSEESIRLQEAAARNAPATTNPLEKLRLLCFARTGSAGILGFGKVFRRMDDNQNHTLSFDEFEGGLKEAGFIGADALSPEQVKVLFQEFDGDGSGHIDYNEFLVKLRPPLSTSRIRLIEQAFDKMDKTGDGQVTLEDLKKVYNVYQNPDFLSGKKTEEEILHNFLSIFEKNMAKPRGPGTGDGILTKEEFFDYYSGVSASIDDDLYFDLMMRKAWKL